jgi:hypothetical protein
MIHRQKIFEYLRMEEKRKRKREFKQNKTNEENNYFYVSVSDLKNILSIRV